MNVKRVILTALLLTWMSLPVFGQTVGSIYISNVTGVVSPNALGVGQEIEWTLNLNNVGTGELVASNNGFRVYSPDGATWTPIEIDTASFTSFIDAYGAGNTFLYHAAGNSGSGTDGDTVGIGGFDTRFPCIGFAPGFDAPSLTIRIPGPGIDSASHGKTICIDSAGYNVNTEWLWGFCDGSGGEVKWGPLAAPYGGPVCYTVINPNAPPELVLSNDSLHFSTIEGGPNPAFQEFTVTSATGQPVAFNLVEDSPWLIPTPISATTPRTIRVDINNLTLSANMYIDTIEVQSAQAANTPLYVVVTLEVAPPPPTIFNTPNVFFFNAIANDTNPDPKTLTIKNVGGSVLNWTVSKTQTWLSLNPGAGTDSGDVEVSVDITGLTLGNYTDTITISDPAADNNSQKVPVNLSVASDLPIIEVDSPFNYVVVESDVAGFDSTYFGIRNGGAGSMDFWLEWDSPRIFTITPDSGDAPATVKVRIKIASGTVGNDYSDTVWVHSNQAINSPVPVVLFMHYVANPASLSVTPPSLNYSLFECGQGVTGFPPFLTFTVNNFGGDNPVNLSVSNESELFTVFPLSGTAPKQFTISTNNVLLPIGIYQDTITIYSPKNEAGPLYLVVTMNVIAGIEGPRIFLMDSVFTFTAQEEHGPIIQQFFRIQNWYGGCMDWSLSESIPWLTVLTDTSGIAPDTVGIYATALGVPFGQYTDSFFITAPSATNSPRKVVVNFKVWRYHGDYNYDGSLNILDLTQMVNYMFRASGMLPQPELDVGDVNCDEKFNVVDLNWLVNYFFRFGPPPCGNPVKKL